MTAVLTDLLPSSLGLCHDHGDPDLWYPAKYSALYEPQIARAKLICSRCPIQAECLAGALRRGEEYGIWGGTTPAERPRPKVRCEACGALVRLLPSGELDAHNKPGSCGQCGGHPSQRLAPRVDVMPCPSPAAYRRHCRHGEDCTPCREAYARLRRDQKRKAREMAEVA